MLSVNLKQQGREGDFTVRYAALTFERLWNVYGNLLRTEGKESALFPETTREPSHLLS